MVYIQKHDLIADELYDRLLENYDRVEKNVVLKVRKRRRNSCKSPVYSHVHIESCENVLIQRQSDSLQVRVVAEIDILAMKGDQIDIYEVKCSRRIVKARKQLYKIRKLLVEHAGYDNVNLYFYYPGLENAQLIE